MTRPVFLYQSRQSFWALRRIALLVLQVHRQRTRFRIQTELLRGALLRQYHAGLDLSKDEGTKLVNDLVSSKNTYEFSEVPQLHASELSWAELS